MAKPRVFLSSTYYDLKYIRRSVEQFVESLGYEATVFESGDVPFSHDLPLDESCYREIGLCHILVLIIGGRYGSASSEERERAAAAKAEAINNSDRPKPLTQAEKDKRFTFYNSVTTKEYQTARELDIPIYIFVEGGVLAEYETYKKNRNAELHWAHVDSANVFRLLDDIFAQSRNNLVREFATADDITGWLRDQWAGLLAHFISKRRENVSVGQLKAQMDSLTSVVSALKTYSEQIVRNVAKSNPEEIISNVDKQLQADQKVLLIRSISGLNHIIKDHHEKPERLFKAFSEAKSFEDLFEKLKQEMGRDACLSAKRDLLSDQLQVNSVRAILGLSSFPPVDPSNLEGTSYMNLRTVRQDREENYSAEKDHKKND